jgi:hypothetical protein
LGGARGTCGRREAGEKCIKSFGGEKQKEKDNLKELSVDGRIILKYILTE